VSLTTGRGPLSPSPAGRFTKDVPEGVGYVEPHPRRIVGERDGTAVIDTERALIAHRPGSPVRFLFLPEDVGDLPGEPAPDAPEYVQVPWDAVDAWFEEGRRLVHYPPNPYHRIDCRPTTRRLRVEVAGVVLVDTDDTTILFETALDPRLYVDPAHVRMDLLRATITTTWCNYKGEATWWAAEVDGTVVDDVAWSYEDPLPESTQIRGFLCFDPGRVDLFDAELPPTS
jgi:uncharacterized protein (DUF427 family)